MTIRSNSSIWSIFAVGRIFSCCSVLYLILSFCKNLAIKRIGYLTKRAKRVEKKCWILLLHGFSFVLRGICRDSWESFFCWLKIWWRRDCWRRKMMSFERLKNYSMILRFTFNCKRYFSNAKLWIKTTEQKKGLNKPKNS